VAISALDWAHGASIELSVTRIAKRCVAEQFHPMSALTLFGLFAVTAMLVFYGLESRGRHYVLAFAGACVLGSAYGFLQGAWPFGLVEGVWSFVALRRWWRACSQV
jgi:hypothetical protein